VSEDDKDNVYLSPSLAPEMIRDIRGVNNASRYRCPECGEEAYLLASDDTVKSSREIQICKGPEHKKKCSNYLPPVAER